MSAKIELRTKIPDLTKANTRALKASIKELSNQMLNEIKNRAPVNTGRLRSSFRVSFTTENNSIKARIESSLPYALMVERGTRAHAIVANNANALHFIVDNRDVFAKSVMHPGIQGRFFIKASVDTILPKFNNILSNNIAKEVRKNE